MIKKKHYIKLAGCITRCPAVLESGTPQNVINTISCCVLKKPRVLTGYARPSTYWVLDQQSTSCGPGFVYVVLSVHISDMEINHVSVLKLSHKSSSHRSLIYLPTTL